jgi:hypothetical protein
MEKLRGIFLARGVRLVVFVEVSELEMMEKQGTDPDINRVTRQIRDMYREGFEIGLHLHPQWYRGRYENGNWLLDQAEYNLCKLPKERIARIVERGIGYLRKTVEDPAFTPLCFRAGNWLLQPTKEVAAVLAENGILVDSSVFKGGLQRNHGMDYRPAIKNGYYWRFRDDVTREDPQGRLIELPTYSIMAPAWKMITSKRIGIGQKSAGSALKGFAKVNRYLDFLRVRYPQKLDFCRMTPGELIGMMDKVILEDRKDPSQFRPIVAIGHTKDFTDPETVEVFLSYLNEKGINVTSFAETYARCVK